MVEIKRKRDRIAVDIAVTVTTVLASTEARIVDLSDHGAQIVDIGMPMGTNMQIEYQDQVVYAQCRWSEVDRMGVFFPFGLADGPLREALQMAISGANMPTERIPTYNPPAPVSAPRLRSGGFGRRLAG